MVLYWPKCATTSKYLVCTLDDDIIAWERIIGPLWHESTSNLWIPTQNSVMRCLVFFCVSEHHKSLNKTISLAVIWDAKAEMSYSNLDKCDLCFWNHGMVFQSVTLPGVSMSRPFVDAIRHILISTLVYIRKITRYVTRYVWNIKKVLTTAWAINVHTDILCFV